MQHGSDAANAGQARNCLAGNVVRQAGHAQSGNFDARECACICLFICGSFNDAVSKPDYIASNDRVIEMNWKHAEGIGSWLIL
jgi:hypothetical protein